MKQTTTGGLTLHTFPSLEALPGLAHAVPNRHGGVSGRPFDSLNLGGGQDDPANVAGNLERLRRAMGLGALVWAHQVHGTGIHLVEGGASGQVAQADGLVTRQRGVGLLIKQADCQAVILAAPARGVLANLHVGWRGNVADMPGKGVDMLRQRFGVEPGEIHAAISPSLGACCAEFVNWAEELPGEFQAFRVGENHFDLVAATRSQLQRRGVPAQNIESSGICTRCDHNFFSYRREGLTGRFGTVAALV